MLRIQYIFIIFLFLILKGASGQFFLSSYFYAYGTDEINVHWDFYSDYPEELLGCNILRYDIDPMQAFQLNQVLITSPDKDFYYLDTFNIADTAIYFYKVEFVFPSDTMTFSNYIGSYESIEFNIVGPTVIELVAVPKNQGDFIVNVYWDNVQVIVLTGTDTFVDELDPFDLELYTNYISYWIWDLDYNDNGTILTSIFHLKELLLTQTPEYSSPEITTSNYPNPFTESTLINLDVGIDNHYQISIYNTNGVLVKTLANKHLRTGKHNFKWDRGNKLGKKVPSGLYYCIINSSKTRKSFKLIVQ